MIIFLKKNYKTEIEHIDIRSLYPLDKKTLIRSAKNKKVLVLDPSWKSYGASGEIVAIIKETLKDEKLFIDRLCYPDSHTPMSQALEEKYYLNENDIITKIKRDDKKMKKIKVSDYLIYCLKKCGIDTYFGVQGGAIAHVM